MLTRRTFLAGSLIAALRPKLSFGVTGPPTIAMAHYDTSQTSWNAAETVLTPANVATIRKLGTFAVDGEVYGQPLYVPGITVSGTVYNLLIVVTMHNSAYAFNANVPGSAFLWKTNFGSTYTGTVGGNAIFYGREVGILSTPVADSANNVVYLVSMSSAPVFTLRKINLSTGASMATVDLAGSFGGVTYVPTFMLQRAGLALGTNGLIYVASGGHDDDQVHGWVMSYNSSLVQQSIFCTTTSGTTNAWGSIWMSGFAPSMDSSGNLYVTAGNGNFTGTTDFGESMIKLSPSLSLVDYFTPTDWATLTAGDLDFTAGVMLIPGTSLAVTGNKTFKIYSVDRTNMGHLGGSSPQIFLTNLSGSPNPGSGVYGGMHMNGVSYFPNTGGKIYAFTLTGSTYNTTPVTSSASFGFPGAWMAGSSNGASNGILWALTCASSSFTTVRAGTLRAFNPTTLAELWNSDTVPADALGNLVKFVPPVVANGRVYAASLDAAVVVYGPAPSTLISGPVTISVGITIQ